MKISIPPQMPPATKIFEAKMHCLPSERHFYSQFSLNGAKHSPLPLPLDRPSADFWGPRAGACFRPFDPMLMIDILRGSRNPQRLITSYRRPMLCLIFIPTEAQEASFHSGNVLFFPEI